MKISVVNSIISKSHFQATKKSTDKATNSIQNNAQPKDNNKNLGLIILGGVGLASIALYGIACRRPDVAKTAKKQVVKVVPKLKQKVPSKKRNAEAFRQYHYEMNMRKMESLRARLLTDEFKDKSPEAMQRIQRNAIDLAKKTGCLKV